MKTYYLFIPLFFLLFVSCTSPEERGNQMAVEMCNCEKSYFNNRNKAAQEFLNSFDNSNYRTRKAARAHYNQLLRREKSIYQNCVNRVSNSYYKHKRDYVSNYQKYLQFEYAYNQTISSLRSSLDTSIIYSDQIEQKIKSIIAPRPSLEQISLDLVGRRIIEQKGGYHRPDWYWEIEEGDIKKLEVLHSDTLSDTEMVYDLHFFLQRTGCAHECWAQVNYQLSDDDWCLYFLKNQKISIVKTGKYDDCVTSEWTKGGFFDFNNVLLTNHCDISLAVGGQALINSKWEKFSVVVDPNSTAQLGMCLFANITSYKIDFIEPSAF